MINVSYALKHIGQPVAFDVTVELPPVDGAAFNGVKVTGEAVGLDMDNLSVSGRLTAVVTQLCARCNRATDFPIDCAFEEIFARTPTAERPDSFLFEGNQIDLAQLAECLIVLALPIRVLCKEDCEGLCPICGKDQNDGLCRHE